MDRQSDARFEFHTPKMHMFPMSGPCLDPEVVEVSSSSWVSNNRSKRKWVEATLDISKINEVGPTIVTALGEGNPDKKNKQPVEYPNDLSQNFKSHIPPDLFGFNCLPQSGNDTSVGPLKSIAEESYHYLEDDTDSSVSDCEEDDTGDVFETDAYGMAVSVAFEHMDLPPGVEAAVPWLHKHEPENIIKRCRQGDEVGKRILFKKFDTVQDASDHYFNKGYKGKGVATKPTKAWTKRIQHEWKVLEKDLPDMIFVRVYEQRLDLLRAAIVGPAGTPYHDGLFFFDVFFPSNYPSVPPQVHYHSGGLRLNPNLYDCGKVCLSLLGTWDGKGCEKWNPDKSSMLQVLVSIQALVLNAKPYFNEPGYANYTGTHHGERASLLYNEQSFLLSCKTMLYSLRRPPKNFEDYVHEHFQKFGRAILVACDAYMNGAQVGCVDSDGVQDVDEGDTSSSTFFRGDLKVLFEELLMEFTIKGADCDDFLARKAKTEVKQADPTLWLLK